MSWLHKEFRKSAGPEFLLLLDVSVVFHPLIISWLSLGCAAFGAESLTTLLTYKNHTATVLITIFYLPFEKLAHVYKIFGSYPSPLSHFQLLQDIPTPHPQYDLLLLLLPPLHGTTPPLK